MTYGGKKHTCSCTCSFVTVFSFVPGFGKSSPGTSKEHVSKNMFLVPEMKSQSTQERSSLSYDRCGETVTWVNSLRNMVSGIEYA